MYYNTEMQKRSHAVNIDVSRIEAFLAQVVHQTQDIRDLVLHIVADAPPPNWLRTDVCLNLSKRN